MTQREKRHETRSRPVYVDERGVYRTEFDPAGSATPSTVASHLLADASDVDVSDAMAALADAVDPDSLDRLFAPGADGTRRRSGLVDFVAFDRQVTVYADGVVVVQPAVGQ